MFDATVPARDVHVDDYAGLVLPGGVANPDQLRIDESSVDLVRQFVAAGKPVAVICHGPWTLVEADVVEGRTLDELAERPHRSGERRGDVGR